MKDPHLIAFGFVEEVGADIRDFITQQCLIEILQPAYKAMQVFWQLTV